MKLGSWRDILYGGSPKYIGGVIVGVGVGMLASFSIESGGWRFVIGIASLLIGHTIASTFSKGRPQDHDCKQKIDHVA